MVLTFVFNGAAYVTHLRIDFLKHDVQLRS
jgi:hypothetical protein